MPEPLKHSVPQAKSTVALRGRPDGYIPGLIIRISVLLRIIFNFTGHYCVPWVCSLTLLFECEGCVLYVCMWVLSRVVWSAWFCWRDAVRFWCVFGVDRTTMVSHHDTVLVVVPKIWLILVPSLIHHWRAIHPPETGQERCFLHCFSLVLQHSIVFPVNK